jgi:hypothetical protein
MAKLARGSSGQKHLRWARQILANMNAQAEDNYLLQPNQQTALQAEILILEGLVKKLSGPVSDYRTFLETAYTQIRAKQSVGDFLCDEAQRDAKGQLGPRKATIAGVITGGIDAIFSNTPFSRVLTAGKKKTIAFAINAASKIRPLTVLPNTAGLADALDKAAAVLQATVTQQETIIDPKRAPLRIAVESAVFQLRDGLEKIDGRLRSHLTQEFIDSLYPELARNNAALADEADEEDDDTALPANPS